MGFDIIKKLTFGTKIYRIWYYRIQRQLSGLVQNYLSDFFGKKKWLALSHLFYETGLCEKKGPFQINKKLSLVKHCFSEDTEFLFVSTYRRGQSNP